MSSYRSKVKPGLMQRIDTDAVCRGSQHSKFCTSPNTGHLKFFILLQILSFHPDLHEITALL